LFTTKLLIFKLNNILNAIGKFPDDSKKKVFTEIMAFSFNQK